MDQGRRSVLIVEDDEAFRYAVARHLTSKGYRVAEASGSMEAMVELDRGGIDVVVIDVMLQPNEPHGLALGRMILNKNPGMTIIVVTGRRDIAELETYIPGEVLYKPVELEELSDKIRELLTR
jgi:DNA-binding NtrC family response regulator